MTTPDPPPTGTLHSLAIHLAHAVQPLEDAFRTPQTFITLMFELGWEVDGLPPEYVTLADQVVTAGAALEALDADPSVTDVLTVISKVGDVYRGISALTTAPGGVDPAVFLPEIESPALRISARTRAAVRSSGLVRYPAQPRRYPLRGHPGRGRAPGVHPLALRLGPDPGHLLRSEPHPAAPLRLGYARLRVQPPCPAVAAAAVRHRAAGDAGHRRPGSIQRAAVRRDCTSGRPGPAGHHAAAVRSADQRHVPGDRFHAGRAARPKGPRCPA